MCEVVGVVRQVRGRPDEREAYLQVYRPVAQRPTNDIYLVVRPASGEAAPLTSAVRAAIARIDREQLVGVRDIRTLGDVGVDGDIAPPVPGGARASPSPPWR